MEVARHGQSTENEKLVAFLQYIKKKLSQLLLCSIVMQNIQIFYGGPVIFVVTSCFLKKVYEVRASGLQVSFKCFGSRQLRKQ